MSLFDNLKKKSEQIAQGVWNQVNPFDGGKTYANPQGNVQPVQQAIQNAKYGVLANNPQKQNAFLNDIKPTSFNPLKAGASSFGKSAVDITKGIGGTVGNTVQANYSAGRLGAGLLTGNKQATFNARKALGSDLGNSLLWNPSYNQTANILAGAASGNANLNKNRQANEKLNQTLREAYGNRPIANAQIDAYTSGLNQEDNSRFLGTYGLTPTSSQGEVIKRVGLPIASTGAQIALNATGFGAGAKTATNEVAKVTARQAFNNVAKPALGYGTANAGIGAADALANGGSNLDAAKAAAIGFGTGVALPVAGYAGGRLARGVIDRPQLSPADLQKRNGLLVGYNKAIDQGRTDLARGIAQQIDAIDATTNPRLKLPFKPINNQIGAVGRNVLPDNIEQMRLYHGSNAKFDKFDPARIGSGEGSNPYGGSLNLFGEGAYLTDNRAAADVYALSAAKRKYAMGYKEDGILSDYQYPKNIDELAANDKVINEFNHSGKVFDAIKEKVTPELVDVIANSAKIGLPKAEVAKEVERALVSIRSGKFSNSRGELTDILGKFNQPEVTAAVRKYLQEKGYDGVKYPAGQYEGTTANNYVIFDPNKLTAPAQKKTLFKPINQGGFVANPFYKDGTVRPGVSKDQIFKGVDGRPRVEFDDSAARIANPNGKTLGEVLYHPELFKQYPELQNIKVVKSANKNNTAGSYDGKTNSISINPNIADSQQVPTLLHEIQHAIQSKEGFARGGSPKAIAGDRLEKDIQNLTSRINSIEGAIPGRKGALTKKLLQLYDKYKNLDSSNFEKFYEDYRRLAGEVEARTVAVRSKLEPQYRTAIPFEKMYDVPKNKQLVSYGDVPAMSIKNPLGDGAKPEDILQKVQAAYDPTLDSGWRGGVENTAKRLGLHKEYLAALNKQMSGAFKENTGNVLPGKNPLSVVPKTDFTKSGKLPDVLNNPKLYEKYPHLKDVNVRYADTGDMNPGTVATHNMKTNTITIDSSLTDAQKYHSLVHEIQHSIQKSEGRLEGGSNSRVLGTEGYQTNPIELEAIAKAKELAPDGYIPTLRETMIAQAKKNPLGKEPKPNAVNEYADMLQSMESSLKGGQMIGDSTNGYKRISEHTPFYRDFYARNGKAPTKVDWQAEAERQLKAGKAEGEFQKAYNDQTNPEVASLLQEADKGALKPSGVVISEAVNKGSGTKVQRGLEIVNGKPQRFERTVATKKLESIAKQELPNISEKPVDIKSIDGRENAPIKQKFLDLTNKYLGNQKAGAFNAVDRAKKFNEQFGNLTEKQKNEVIFATDDPKFTTKDPAVQRAVDYLHAEFDSAYRLFTEDKGLKLNYQQSYYPRQYKNVKTGDEISAAEYNLLQRSSARQKGRTSDTLAEWKLVTRDPAEALVKYYTSLEKAAAGQKYLNGLKSEGLVISSSEPVRGMQPVIAEGMQENGMIYYAKPDVAKQLNRLFGSEKASGFFEKSLEKAQGVNSFMQSFVLSGGVPNTPLNAFGVMQFMKNAMALHPIQGGKAFYLGMTRKGADKFFEKNQSYIQKMTQNGLDVRYDYRPQMKSAKADIATAFKDKGTAKAIAVGWDELTNDATFGRFMPALETLHFKGVYNKLVKTMPEAEAAKTAAKATANFFGKNTLAKDATRSKVANDASGALLFAPRFRESMLNFWVKNAQALKPGNITKPEYRDNVKFMAAAALTYGVMDGINYAENGVHMYQNPDGKKDKLLLPGKDGQYVGVPFLPSIATVPRNLGMGAYNLATGNFDEAGKNAKSFLSIPARAVGDILTNENYFGAPIVQKDATGGERAAQIGSYLVKNNLQPWIREGLNAAGQNLPDETKKMLGIKKQTGAQTASQALELPFRFYDSQNFKGGSDKFANATPDQISVKQLKKDNQKRQDTYQKSFSKDDWELLQLSKADKQKLVDGGAVTQEKIDGLQNYADNKRQELGFTDNQPKPTPKQEYETARKEYDKNQNTLSIVEKKKQTEDLKRLKVASDYDRDTVSLHGMNKQDVWDLLSTDKNGKALADKLLAYDNALTKAGVQDKNKFTDKYGNIAIQPKAKGSGGGRRKSGLGATVSISSLAKKPSYVKVAPVKKATFKKSNRFAKKPVKLA